MTRPLPRPRHAYRRFCTVTPRWNDTDVFGHINNAEYYGLFDTAVVHFLLEGGVIAISGGAHGMVVAESGCRYLSELRFTDALEVGLAVERLGTSSVRYSLALFANGASEPAAEGFFVHVLVDRASMRPTAMPDSVRRHFETILAPEGALQ